MTASPYLQQPLRVLRGEASHFWLLELIPSLESSKRRLQARNIEVYNLFRKAEVFQLFKRLTLLCTYVCLYEFMCTVYVQIPVGATKFPGTRVLGSCELPMWVLGIRLGSSARTENAFNH